MKYSNQFKDVLSIVLMLLIIVFAIWQGFQPRSAEVDCFSPYSALPTKC